MPSGDICLGGSCCGERMGYHDICRLYVQVMRGACARDSSLWVVDETRRILIGGGGGG